MFSAASRFSMSTNPFQGSWSAVPVRLSVCASVRVCVCARAWHWSAARFSRWQELVRERTVVPVRGFGRVPAVLAPPRLRKPPHRLGTLRLGAVSVRGLPPALGPADFNYSLLGWIHRWLPGRRRLLLPTPPGCSFPQWISRATMKQKLVASPFFTQPGVRGWPFTPGDSGD